MTPGKAQTMTMFTTNLTVRHLVQILSCAGLHHNDIAFLIGCAATTAHQYQKPFRPLPAARPAGECMAMGRADLARHLTDLGIPAGVIAQLIGTTPAYVRRSLLAFAA